MTQTKISLSIESALSPKRGEIWRIQFDPALGDEIRKTRPAVVVSDPELGVLKLRIVVPITGWREVFAERPWMTSITPIPNNGLTKRSAVDSFQCKSVSLSRFRQKLGDLLPQEIEDIVEAIAICIKL